MKKENTSLRKNAVYFTVIILSLCMSTSVFNTYTTRLEGTASMQPVQCSEALADIQPVASINNNAAPTESTEGIIENDPSFTKLVSIFMRLGHMSGLSTAIVSDEELIWAQGFGLSDREKQKQTTPETIFLVASISKTFTATAVMQLVEQGLIDLDADVNAYLNFSVRNPSYPDDPITVRMLLSHQSSLAYDIKTNWARLMPADLTISGYPYPYLEEFFVPEGIHYKPQFWREYTPGEGMDYANSGFALLGYLIERVTGQSCASYCKEHIFEPLQMNNTSFWFSDLNSSQVAVPYKYTQEYLPYQHYQLLDYPAGGLRTTVVDLSRFLLAQMNKGTYNDAQILTPESVELMHTIISESDTYLFKYGLGFQIWDIPTGTYVGHTGDLLGVATKMVYEREDKVGIIMFTNKGIKNLREHFYFALIEQLIWMKAQQATQISTPPSSLLSTGQYHQPLV